MKIFRYSALIFLLIASTVKSFGQVPVVDSITHNDFTQQVIRVDFSEILSWTAAGTWTIRIGGAAVPFAGPLTASPSNNIIFQLATPITYNDVLAGITVDYAGDGDFTNGSNNLAGFVGTPAINTNVFTCDALVPENLEFNYISGPCAQVRVSLKIGWSIRPWLRNSSNLDVTELRIRYRWGDPADTRWNYTPDEVNKVTDNPEIGSGYFAATSDTFTYPDSEVCLWQFRSYMYYLGTPTKFCSTADKEINQAFVNYRLDNQTLGGNLILDPPIGDPRTLICVGEDFAVTFQDVSEFNCNINVEPFRPNEGKRNVQFVYGTNTNGGPRIPNVYVKYGPLDTDTVHITNNNGDPISFPTPSGFYEGPVVEIPEPATASGLFSYPVMHQGDFINDQAGDRIEITVRNWNPCNPYGPFWHFGLSDPPITTYSYIELILSPPAPNAPDQTDCESAVGPLTATGTGGTLRWYSDAGLTTLVGTGGTLNHGQTVPGVYTYWVNETLGSGCVGPATMVTLTIREDLVLAGPIVGPDEVCVNQANVSYNFGPGAPVMPIGGATKYVWTIPGDWTLNSQTSKTIFVDIGPTSGSRTVSAHLEYFAGIACPSNTINRNVEVNPLPVGNPASYESCTGTQLDITPTTNVSGSTFTWSGSNGSSGTGNIDDTPVNAGPADLIVTYTVTPTGPAPSSCPGATFDITVTVNALPTVATAGADDLVCATTYPNLGGNNPAIGTGQWTVVSDIIWREDFEDLSVGTTADAGATPWTRDLHGIILPARPGHFEVKDASGGGKWFELNNSGDPYVDWISGPIDISGSVGTVELSIKLQEPGNNTLENGDWIEGWYSVDGGAEQVFFARIPNDYTGPIWRTLGGISGNTLTIRINARTGATNEFQTFDDVTVRDEGIGVLATVDNPALNNSGASSLQPDENTFRWTISNGVCPVTFEDITITRDVTPSSADAGLDQTFCDLTSTNLDAVPVDNGGTGTWTRLSGPASITSPNDPTTEVTGLGYGANDFQWEVTSKYGACPASTDDMTVTRDNPVLATVGPDQDFCMVLPGNSAALGGSNPAPGTGLWSMVSGPAAVTGWIPDATTPNAQATVTSYGVYLLKWEITNGTCVTSDTIEVDFGQAPSPSVPGPNDITCGLVYTFGATAPVVGQGTWTLDSGPGAASYDDENSEVAEVTVTAYGTYIFRWTITSGSCAPNVNTVQIIFSEPSTADAGSAFTVCRDGTAPAAIPLSGVIGGAATTGSWSVETGSGSLSGSVVALPNVTDSYTPDPSDVGGMVTLRLTAADPDGAGPCIAVESDVIITINEEATADAGADYTVCRDGAAPADLNISGTIGGGATTGSWTIVVGAGSLAGSSVAGTTVSDVYTPGLADIGGTITLQLIATDPDGAGPCLGDTDDIIISFSEAATSDAGSDLTVCRTQTAPAVINISGTIGGAATTGSWSISSGAGTLGGSSVAGTTVSDTYTPAPADVGNTVRLTLTAADPDGGALPCLAVPDDMDIIINMAAESDAGADYTVCRDGAAPAIIPLSGTIGGGATTGTWSIASGAGSIGASTTVGSTVTATYTPVAGDVGGTVEMRLTATDPDGAGPCGNTPDDVIITINETAISDAGANYTVCRSSVTLLAIPLSGTIGGAATTGSWSVVTGNGTMGGSTTVGNTVTASYTPDATDVGGTVTLRLTADDPDGAGPCGDSISDVVITINEAAESDAGADYAVCRDETAPAVIDLTGTIGGAATTGSWSIVTGNGSISASTVLGNTVTATYTTDPSDVGGTVRMQLTAADPDAGGPCGDVQDIVDISVNMEAEVDAGSNFTVCRDGVAPANIDLSGTIGGGATSGTWDVVTGNGTMGASTTVGNTVTASYTPDPADVGGFVQLRLTATDPDGIGPCLSISDLVNVTVNLAPTVDAGVDLAIAAGNPASLLGSFGGSTGSITWTGGLGVFDPNENNPNADYYPTLAEETAGSVELVMVSDDPDGAGPCTIVTDTMVIFIGENPTADAGPNFDICEIDSIPLIGVIGGSATVGTWTVIVGAGTVYDNVTGADDTVRAVYVTTPAERAADVATGYIRVQLETDDPDGAGPVQPDSSRKDITIYPLPVTPAIAGPTQACVNTVNMVYISNPLTPNSYYEWNVPLVLGTVTSGGSGYNNNAAIMNAAAVAASDTIWLLETTQFGCVGDTVKLGLEIFDYPAQSVITGPNTVCANDTAVDYSVPLNPGSTYQWFRPPGAFVNPPDTANAVKIDFGFSSGIVSVMETNPAGCITTHIPLPVTVSPLPTANLNASDVIICPGQPVTFTATPAGMANYDFFVDDTLAQSGILATYLTDSLTDGQTVTVEVTNAGGCRDMSTGITIIVSTVPDISLVSSDADNIICFNESVTFTATSATGVSFEFFVDGLSVQNSPLTFFTTDTLHDGETVTVTTRDIVGCESTSPGITTTVNPLPVADLSGDAIICPTDATNLSINITTGLTPFTVELDNGVGPIAGYGSNDPIPVSPLSTTVYNLVNVIDANGCRVDAPHANLTGTATVTLNEDISVITQPIAVTDCPGSDIPFQVLVSGTAPAYQWRKDGIGLVNGGNISGADTDELSITNIQAVDAGMYDVVVSGTCLPATSAAVPLTVLEDITITGNPVDVIECPGGTIQFGAAATGTNPVYRWRKNGTPLLDGGTISGTATDTMQIAGITVLDAGSYDVIVTGTCVPDTSTAATLTLNIQPNIVTQPDAVVECEGGLVTFFVDAGTTTNPTYEWQVDSLLGPGFQAVSGGPYSGENTPTLTVNPIDSDMNGFQFRVLVGGDCNPSVLSNEVGLTVLEIPEIIEHPTDSTICEDASVTFAVNAGVTAVPVYAWEVNDGGGWDPIVGAPYFGFNSAQLGILSAPSTMNGYQYRVNISGSCAPPVQSAIATLTINQKPEVGVHPVDAVECEDGLVTFTVDPGLTTNPAYQWQVDDGSGFTDISGGIYTGENTTTLTVDPISSGMNGYRYRARIAGTCAPEALSNPASLTVDENPEILVDPTDQTICEGDIAIFFVNPGLTTDPTFVWEYNTGAGWNPVPADAVHAGINNDTLFLTAAPSTMDTWRYRVVVDGKCNVPVTSLEATLTVNQRPEILLQPVDSTICEDADATFTVDAGVTTGATYQWQVSTGAAFSNIFGGLYTGENTPVLTITGAAAAMDGFMYRVIVGGICTPAITSDTAILTVLQKPEVLISPTDVTICEDDNALFGIDPGVTTTPAYQWQVDEGAGFNDILAGPIYSGFITDTLYITGGISAMDGNIYRVVVSGACAPDATSEEANLTVWEKPEIIAQPQDSAICEGGAATFTVDAGVTTNPSYQWQVDDGGGFVNVFGAVYVGQNSATLNIFNAPSSMNGYLYRVIVSGNCTPADTSNAALFNVSDRPEILTQPSSATVCEDDIAVFGIDAGVTSNPLFVWEVDDGSGFVPVPGLPDYTGENTDTLIVNSAYSALNGNIYRVVVSGTCVPPVVSTAVFLTVNEKPEIIAQPTDTTICEGASAMFNIDAGLTSSPSFVWQVNEGAGWIDATGAPYVNENTPGLGIMTTTSLMNNYQYRAIVSGVCAPADTSLAASLFINEVPEIISHPTDTTQCEDGNVTFGVDAGVTTAAAYQWQVDQGFGFVDVAGGIYSGINTDTLVISGITSAMQGYRYRVVVSGTCTPPAISNPARLYINEKPEILLDPVDVTICEDDNAIFFVNVGVTTTPAFAWEYNTGAGWNPLPADAVHSGVDNDTLFLIAAPSTMNTWRYRVVVSGTCTPPVTSGEAELTVHDRPEIILQPVDSTICEDGDATFTVDAGVTTSATYQWQVSSGGAFNNIFGAVYSGENTPILQISSALSFMDGYQYRVLVGGTCTPGITSDTATLTVLEKPEILSQPVDMTICEDDNALFGINSGVTTNPVYQWQVDDGLGGGFVDILAGPLYSGFSTDTLHITAAISAMDSYQYRVIVYGDCAPNDTSDAVSLIVYEKPEIISQPMDSTICEFDNASFGVNAGVTTTPLYQWQVDDGSGFVNAFGPFYLGQNSDTLRVNNAPSSMNGYRFRVIISGACTPADTSVTVTLTVHDRPEILIQPSAPVVCEDGSTLIGIDAGVTTIATFQWQVDDHLGGGFSDISAAPYTGFNTDTLYISPVVSAMHGYSYQVILGGACPPSLTSNEVDLTVNEKPEVIVHPVDSTVCEGAQSGFSVDAGVTTMAAYEWLVDEGAGFATISGGPYFGENTANLMVTTTDSSMNGFRYRVVISGTCTPNDTSNAATLTVLDRPEIASHPVDTTECEDGLVTFGVDAGKTTVPAYQWQVDQGMGFTDISGGDYAGFNADTLTAFNINTAMHGYRYRVIVSGTCTPDATSGFASLFINEKPEVSKDPDDITVCEFDGASFDVAPGLTTDPEYRWEYDQGSGTWIDVPAGPVYEGVDSNILVINATDVTMDGFQYRAVISGECSPDVTSAEAILTVHERPEITLQPVDETICEDDNISFNVSAGLTTSPTYQWQVSSGAGFNNVGGAVYSGGTTPTLSLSTVPSSMNGYQYRVIIGGSCTPQVISDTVVLTVLEKPEVMIHPDDADECEDGTVIFTVNPGVTTLPAYQWQESTGGPFADLAEGAPYIGVNNDTLMISGIISAMHTNSYRVVISGSCIPDATSNDASLTVYEKPEIILQPTDETICEDGNTSFTVDAGVTTNPTYQWQVDQNSGTFVNVSGGFYSGQNSATLNITGALAYMNGYMYRVIIGGYCAPADTSIEVTLTILEKPEVTEHPSNALVCEGLETYFTVDAGVTTLPVYEWQVDDGSGSFVPVSGAPYQGEDTDSLIITTPTSAMYGYIYRVRISGTCTPDAFSNSAFLFVQENPEVTIQPVDTTICENENAGFTVNAGVTTLPDYQWQVNDGSGWVNLIDAGKYVGTFTSTLNIFNGTADMSGYQYQVIISGECAPPVTSNPATLTVNLRPVINTQPVNSTICEGEISSFNVVATGFGLTYEWQVDDGSGYAPIADAGVYSGAATPTLTVTGPDASYDGFRYRVIVDNYCGPQQSSMIATLTVNSPPSVVTDPVDVAICEFTNTTFQVNAQGGGLSYQWQENDGGGWSDLAEAGNYVGTNTPSLSLFTVDSIMTGYQYRAVITGVCAPPATSGAATLTVNTSPQITVQPVDMAVCETVNAQFSVTAIGDGLLYRWQENNGGGFADIPEGGFYSGTNTATLTINAPVEGMNTNTYRVIVSGTCVPPVTSNFAMLTVNRFPNMITQPASDEICEDGNVTFIATADGTGISYQWQENSGSGWTDIIDGGIYSGATTPTFTLTNVPVTYNGYQYRLNVVGTCAPLPSDVADLIVNANPVASITGDGNFPVVCGGVPMTLDGNPSGGSGTWSRHEWSGELFPINPVDAQVTVFQTAAHGSYNLVYTVTDSKGCMAKDQVTIENDRPDARFTSNARPACGTVTVDFTNESTRAVVYEWNFDDPLNPGVVTDENPSYDFSNFTATVQYFNVELVAFSMNGCTDTAKEVITIYPSIDASFTTDPSEGCNPLTVQLVSTPGGSNYYWDFGDGNAKNGEHHEIHQFVNLGTDPVTYNVSLTTTSFYGCFDTKIMPVTVYPIPQVNFTADPIIQDFPSATVDFNNLTPEGSWGFTWDFDDGNFSNEVSPTHTYGAPGDYTVTLTASTAQCEDSIVHLITIKPAAPIADFVQPEPGCAPLEITFQNNSQFATSYVWDFGNGSTSFKENPTFTYYESGIYSVTLTVFGPGGTDSDTKLVEVYITPNAYTTVAPTYVFVNDVPVKCFNLTTDTSDCSYLWDFGDGETSTVFEPAHVFKEAGRYDITLTATNANQCFSTYVFSYVEVEPAGELLFPNVFKPNPDGPSGGEYVEGQDNNQIFFPGVYDQVIQYELVIYNRWGELIFISNDVNIGWDGYIDGKMMARMGVYVWKVTGKYANGKSFVHVGDITLLK